MEPKQTFESASPAKLITVIFDSEEEYVSFTDYVYDRFNGIGLDFTNVPILTSVRITSWLMEQTREKFRMRVTNEELTRRGESADSSQPLDPAELDHFRVPGIPEESDPSEK